MTGRSSTTTENGSDGERLAELLSGTLPTFGQDDWQAAVEKSLKGRSLDKITARTAEGITVPPLAPRRIDAKALAMRPAGLPWQIVQPLLVTDAAEANAALLEELSGGVGGIDLAFAGPISDLGRLFDGVYTDLVSIHLSPETFASGQVETVARHLATAGGGTLHLGVDPFEPGRTGTADDAGKTVTAAIGLGKDIGLAGTWLAARGQGWHGAGASSAQQIAIALATAAEYLRLADAAGQEDLEGLLSRIEFRLVADQNQFLTIARLRAFRRLHALFAETCGFAAKPAFVLADAAERMMTKRDPWVNILRSTIATFGAAIGGADAILTRPHTAVLGLPDADARRLSRNVQNVLLEESNLHRVADPTAGSGGVETLTDEIAERAWDEFRQIEREGGLARSLAQGGIASRIAEMAEASRKAVARRRKPITGTSTYPLLSERDAAVAAPLPEAPAGAGPVQPYRIAEPWEAFRDASDAVLHANGARPKIFLANLGPVAAFTVRATWAKNLFEAGGIEAISDRGHKDAASLVAAFKASGASIACLCSNDATYETLGAEAASALKTAGATRVLLAGRPGDLEDGLRQAGVDVFAHEGLDMIALLTDVLAGLGVALPAPKGGLNG
ncbi:Methylmalonyl-CoA mutase small subunit [Hartmannibacter diazotrophicus]|uniref:Methylmalonyl-CoA mutase small subunit n=1 Tax=Hartmannibacter diazotrophicus TaxID=1482074 RepID=A0A2C9D5P3_9HYPH|nr:methylmalonyl-CoA mutase family protein [Hartmannibacter diazotrophicus]SON54835.1 Methylmalonyl-CoA mutase small subunit [Hartmannibacter diazotrophicus]